MTFPLSVRIRIAEWDGEKKKREDSVKKEKKRGEEEREM